MKKTYQPLDELIVKTGLKYSAIANRVDVDYSTFYKWRVNPASLTIDNMEKLAVVLNVTFFDIYKIVKKFKDEVDFFATSD